MAYRIANMALLPISESFIGTSKKIRIFNRTLLYFISKFPLLMSSNDSLMTYEKTQMTRMRT